jgi:[ribosomal protein S5]-alanine N-acetyltransferase
MQFDIPLHFGSAPTRLETHRILLRPLVSDDAEALQRCASAREIADDMISIPHPYPEDEASRFIAAHEEEFQAGRSVVFALERKSDRAFCGIIEIRDINRAHYNAEMSFWLAVHGWGNGYMSEALALAVDYAFQELRVNRLHAFHMVRNESSGKVLRKNGFQPEGLLRQCVYKCGKFEDVVLMAQVRGDWESSRSEKS